MTSYHGPNTRRVWCQSPKPEYTLLTQRFVMPTRFISLLRPQDLIVLPGNDAIVRDMWNFFVPILGLTEGQAIWTSGEHYTMDDDMTGVVLAELKAAMTDKDPAAEWLLLPYCPTVNFLRWAEPFCADFTAAPIAIFSEDDAWMTRFGTKGMLHRCMSNLDQPSVVEQIDPTIAVPDGYVCETVEELLAARELMKGCADVCIKPLSGATGVGIVLKPTIEYLKTYDFAPMGPVNLEQYLDLDVDERGEAISPTLHYMADTLCGEFMLDQIMDGTAYIGWSRTIVSQGFQDEAARVMEKFMTFAKPRGAGGVDFLSVNGLPLLTDINSGRFNGAHPAKLFHKMYAPPDSEFFCWKLSVSEMKALNGISMKYLWKKLAALDLHFQVGVTTMGVTPLVALQGLSYQFLAIGPDRIQVMALVNQAKALIGSVGMAQSPLLKPKPFPHEFPVPLLDLDAGMDIPEVAAEMAERAEAVVEQIQAGDLVVKMTESAAGGNGDEAASTAALEEARACASARPRARTLTETILLMLPSVVGEEGDEPPVLVDSGPNPSTPQAVIHESVSAF